MTSKEYEQRLKELENEIKMLKQEKIENDLPKPPHPRWKPKKGEYYYWFNGRGTPAQDKWIASACDQDLYNIGNVFFNLKTTKFAVERLKVLAEMQEWAGDWNNAVVLTYSKLSNKVEVESANYTISGEIRFASFADAKNCIKAVGEERLKKYYFMIPEEKKDDD